MRQIEIRLKNTKQRIPRQLKPNRRYCIVNMPQSVNVAESGSYCYYKHTAIITKHGVHCKYGNSRNGAVLFVEM